VRTRLHHTLRVAGSKRFRMFQRLPPLTLYWWTANTFAVCGLLQQTRRVEGRLYFR